jgi:hypothetical protein
VLAAQSDGLREIAGLAVLVCERREVSARVLVELAQELVNPGGGAHPVCPHGVVFPARSICGTYLAPSQEVNRDGHVK